MRNAKSYDGLLMKIGTAKEEIILKWLKKHATDGIDCREFRLAQRIDVDFGVETLEGDILLAEIKSDKWIREGCYLAWPPEGESHV